jgi:hypothetical protein
VSLPFVLNTHPLYVPIRLYVSSRPEPVAAGRFTRSVLAGSGVQVITESLAVGVYGWSDCTSAFSVQCALTVVVAVEPAELVVSPVSAGSRAAGSVPAERFPAFVASVEQLVAESDRSAHAGRAVVPRALVSMLVTNWCVVAEFPGVFPFTFATVTAPVLSRLMSPDTGTSVATFEPLPTSMCADVSALDCLALNVPQSVLVRYPLCVASAAWMVMFGVAPPLLASGEDAVTLVTDPLDVAEIVQSVRVAPELSAHETVAFEPLMRFNVGRCVWLVPFSLTVWYCKT